MKELVDNINDGWKKLPHQVTVFEYINDVNSRQEKNISFLRQLNVLTSNMTYEVGNIEVWEDWKVKKIHIMKKNDKKWELQEIIINSYGYKLEPNSSYNTDDESLVTRFKWEIKFKSKIKWIEWYIKEILKQFHEIEKK